ncbi:phospholipase C [Paraburkholderia silvatlantica]|uniref:Phospholipase C n=1 Tax=Paraburkholderia silvatlantica TaxID=321895 RepID=A0A2V4TQ80_9BURK|nr:phospholipase C [Paraburkholderia silvatlantica]
MWFQPSSNHPNGYSAPFHMDTLRTSAQCQVTLDHTWSKTHAAINRARHDGWIVNKGEMTMGYFTRADIPFHYALADAFTVCDQYFASIPGQTHPNRSYLMTGMVDPTGQQGGPLLDNYDYVDGATPPGYELLSWKTFPERLETAGITWQIYQQGLDLKDEYNGNYGTNILMNFEQYVHAPTGSSLHKRAMVARTLSDLKDDVTNGRLPQVSWLLPPAAFSEHPKYSPGYGADYTARVLDALTANPETWSKTVLFIMYDENDGFFDHIVPPQPAASRDQGLSTVSTEGEIHNVINPKGRHGDYVADNLPYGLGLRVPMTVVSPWSKGGFVCSQVFDHTSVIRFIESRFGVHEPNITPWRRAVCGDLTSAFDFSASDAVFPPLPDTAGYMAMVDEECRTNPFPAAPSRPQVLEPQESGTRPARPIPYQLRLENSVCFKTDQVTLKFINEGQQGAHFYVYSDKDADGPWSYTVEAETYLSDSFSKSPDHSYGYRVYGPNGFFRYFRGSAKQIVGSSAPSYLLQMKESYDVHNGDLKISFTNVGTKRARVVIRDNAYGRKERSVTIAASQSAETHWTLTDSACWYDFSVYDASSNDLLFRLAGHLETGRVSTSDPAATHVVTQI